MDVRIKYEQHNVSHTNFHNKKPLSLKDSEVTIDTGKVTLRLGLQYRHNLDEL